MYKRMNKRLSLVFTLALLFTMMGFPQAAEAKVVYPKKITLKKSSLVLDLASRKTEKLKFGVSPGKASRSVRWSSSNSKVVSVSGGTVTAKKVGTATITVRSKYNTRKDTIKVSVVNTSAPKSVKVSSNKATINVGAKKTVTASVLPAKAKQAIKWTTSNSKVVRVNATTGEMTGVKKGTATVTAYCAANTKLYKKIAVTVAELPQPKTIKITKKVTSLTVGGSFKMQFTVTPSSTKDQVEFVSSNTKVLTAEPDGTFKAVGAGTAVARVRSTVKSSVAAYFTVTVKNPVPTKVALSKTTLKLTEGDKGTVTATVTPANANQTVTWTSSNEKIAKVSGGEVLAVYEGSATITATTSNGLKATVAVTVQPKYPVGSGYGGVVTTLPMATTAIVSGSINANLQKVTNLQRSAQQQVDKLRSSGKITAAEATMRKLIVQRAYEMKAFPWTVEKNINYWNDDKNRTFVPGQVYYGLPYIQHSKGDYSNRRYDVTKAVKEGRYLKSKSGPYYELNFNKLMGGRYVGNDCSSYVSQAMWGTTHSASYYNTASLLTSTYYKTITDTKAMRPGDILVYRDSGGGHTVMFMYYTDAAKTQMMIIQQGGGGQTIITGIKAVSSYIKSGYRIRRRYDFSMAS